MNLDGKVSMDAAATCQERPPSQELTSALQSFMLRG